MGASKNTDNIGGYYENNRFGARLSYTYRSEFFVGLDRSTPQYQDDTGTLSRFAQLQPDRPASASTSRR